MSEVLVFNTLPIANIPVLFIDTCSILDIMRDPTRETMKLDHGQAAIDIITAAEAGRVKCYMAEQVAIEFLEHDMRIQLEADAKLKKFRDLLIRVNDLVTLYGASGTLDVSHFNDHTIRARAIVERWLTQLETVYPSDPVHKKVSLRVSANRAPARQGKDSFKDCLVYETVLEKAVALRASGGTAPIVFLSSNTKEYQTEGSALNSQVAIEFGKLDLGYAPNMSAAKHDLGV